MITWWWMLILEQPTTLQLDRLLKLFIGWMVEQEAVSNASKAIRSFFIVC
jgi:hypothetical protein